MGLVIIRRAKNSLDYTKLRLLLTNPVSKSAINELLRPVNGREMILDLLDHYPERPEGLSTLTFKYSKFVLDSIRDSTGSDGEFGRSLSKPAVRRSILNILKTLRKHGLTKPMKFYSPLLVVWNITSRCNLKCRHCYEDAGSEGTRSCDSEQTLDEKLPIIDQIAESDIPALSLSGGEPLIHPDFWPIAEKAHERGLYLSIATNGTLITRDVAKRLADLDLAYVGISLDAPSAAFHDEFRGVPGAFEKALQGIRYMVDTPTPTIMAVTVTSRNHMWLPDMFKLADDLGVDKVMAYNFIPTGRGSRYLDLDMTPEQREESLRVQYEYLASGGTLSGTMPQLGRLCSENEHPNLAPWSHASGPGKVKGLDVLVEMIGGCGAGRAYMAIQPDGTITPCVYMPDVPIGHVSKDTLLDVWQNSELIETLGSRDGLKGHCGVCEHKALCGGCRARAHAYFDDFQGPDPGCINNRDYAPAHPEEEQLRAA